MLVDGGTALAGAGAIARHLGLRHPRPALWPAEADARAYCALLESWAETALGRAVGALVWQDRAEGRALARELARELATGPLWPFAARWVWRRARHHYYADRGNARAAESRAREHLQLLAALLDQRPFLLGDHLTVADVSAWVHVARLERTAARSLLEESSVVAAWAGRVHAVPAIAAVLPP